MRSRFIEFSMEHKTMQSICDLRRVTERRGVKIDFWGIFSIGKFSAKMVKACGYHELKNINRIIGGCDYGIWKETNSFCQFYLL